LAIDEASLGIDHPDTATSLHNLAGVLHDQGDLQGAHRLFERLGDPRAAPWRPPPRHYAAASFLRRWWRRWTISSNVYTV
jgi:Tetratricopeptide repeat